MKTINVTVTSGNPAAEVHSSPKKPLAVTRMVGSTEFAVTHVASGMAIVKHGSRAAARRAMGACNALDVDWTQGAEDLLKDRARIAPLMREIKTRYENK